MGGIKDLCPACGVLRIFFLLFLFVVLYHLMLDKFKAWIFCMGLFGVRSP